MALGNILGGLASSAVNAFKDYVNENKNNNKGSSSSSSNKGSSGSSSASSSSSGRGNGGGSNGWTEHYKGGNAELDAALKPWQDAYQEARANGDWEGMQAASNGGNKVRNEWGYAAEDASVDIGRFMGGSSSGSSGGGYLPSYRPGNAGGADYPFQFGSKEEFMEEMGYQDWLEQQQKAVDAAVQQTVNTLNGQKTGVNQNADQMARQAYISYMQSKDRLPQTLAAGGYSGGMADSQALALEADLQNSQKDIMLNRDNTLSAIDQAIANARLEGDIQGAQQQAAMGQQAMDAWMNYMNQANAYANQDYWQKYGYDFQGGQAGLDRLLQREQMKWQSDETAADRNFQSAQSDRDRIYDALFAGVMLPESMLAAAGISTAAAQNIVSQVKALNAAKNSRSRSTSSTRSTQQEESGDEGNVNNSSGMPKQTGIDPANFAGLKQTIYTVLQKGDGQAALSYVNQTWDQLSENQKRELIAYFNGRGYELNPS